MVYDRKRGLLVLNRRHTWAVLRLDGKTLKLENCEPVKKEGQW